jgi:hypothetical protein
MRRSKSYSFGALVIAIAMMLSACGAPAPSGSVPTSTVVPPTQTVFIPPTVTTIAFPTDTATLDIIASATPTDTLASSPVSGSVLIEGGRSIAGGVENDTIELSVQFTADSTAGTVEEMRVDTGMLLGCQDEEALASQPWQPFVAEQAYTTTAIRNFQGWYVNVQYRDVAGNISPVYCDDISIEGMPPTPTR